MIFDFNTNISNIQNLHLTFVLIFFVIRSHPIWELPINELDRRDDPTYDERLSGCHLVSSCSNIYEKSQFARLLRHNFNRHYQTNRAPLSLSFDAAWLKVNKGFTRVLSDWISETLEEHNDVYFLTGLQVITIYR